MCKEGCYNMANIIIKNDERRERHEQILSDFGHDPQTANREAL